MVTSRCGKLMVRSCCWGAVGEELLKAVVRSCCGELMVRSCWYKGVGEEMLLGSCCEELLWGADGEELLLRSC